MSNFESLSPVTHSHVNEQVYAYLPTSIDNIADIVSRFYRIPIDKMKSKTRKREIVKTRQTTMYLSKLCTRDTLKTIGNWFGGRDHTTVIHSCQTVKDLMDTDPEYRKQVQLIEGLIMIN